MLNSPYLFVSVQVKPNGKEKNGLIQVKFIPEFLVLSF